MGVSKNISISTLHLYACRLDHQLVQMLMHNLFNLQLLVVEECEQTHAISSLLAGGSRFLSVRICCNGDSESLAAPLHPPPLYSCFKRKLEDSQPLQENEGGALDLFLTYSNENAMEVLLSWLGAPTPIVSCLFLDTCTDHWLCGLEDVLKHCSSLKSLQIRDEISEEFTRARIEQRNINPIREQPELE